MRRVMYYDAKQYKTKAKTVNISGSVHKYKNKSTLIYELVRYIMLTEA